ncbi:MAG: hypothetical protein WC058_14235 [Phycisphaeraceae bacterium]
MLIGPNASGETTFLDVVGFPGDLLSHGLDEAITERSSDIHDLFSFRKGDRFELAVELEIPAAKKAKLPPKPEYRFIRYEVSIGWETKSGEHHIFDEQVILLEESSHTATSKERPLFPDPMLPPTTIMHSKQAGKKKKRIVRKVYERNDNFYSEVGKAKGQGG